METVTSGNLLRKIGWASAGATLALGFASTGIAGAAPATTTVSAEFDCTSVDVSSSRHDLSNVVLLFDGGSTQRFEGLSGKTGTFAGTGDFASLELDGVWIKAGNNSSGDGPGYGEFVDAPDDTCGSPESTASNTSTTSNTPSNTSEDTTSAGTESHGDDAVVGAQLDCDGSVIVTSTKDLSNVVLVLSDGSEIKFDGLSGHEATFEAPEGLTIVGVYVKSGANHSGDGPGYGEKVIPAAADDCDTDSVVDTETVVDTDTVVKTDAVVDTTAVQASVELPGPAVLGTSIAGERAAAPAVEGAQVLGVTIERSPAVAAAANAAPATLAFTGLDLSSLLLASGGLMTSGAVLVRRTRRRS